MDGKSIVSMLNTSSGCPTGSKGSVGGKNPGGAPVASTLLSMEFDPKFGCLLCGRIGILKLPRVVIDVNGHCPALAGLIAGLGVCTTSAKLGFTTSRTSPKIDSVTSGLPIAAEGVSAGHDSFGLAPPETIRGGLATMGATDSRGVTG